MYVGVFNFQIEKVEEVKKERDTFEKMDQVLQDLLEELAEQQHQKSLRLANLSSSSAIPNDVNHLFFNDDSSSIQDAYEQRHHHRHGGSIVLRQKMSKSSFEYKQIISSNKCEFRVEKSF